ncbi:hypothetical protein WY02_27040 [Pseudonocardia sp. AL041005-10]|nr:hypothetical protein WY02_27040 [Pseudonocardia sp. AL041005-10]
MSRHRPSTATATPAAPTTSNGLPLCGVAASSQAGVVVATVPSALPPSSCSASSAGTPSRSATGATDARSVSRPPRTSSASQDPP